MKLNTDKWFTEIYPEDGCALSLEVSEKLHQEQTEFQSLEVYQTTAFGKLMLLDGCIMLTDRDNFIYHEMMTHPALYSHPNPKRVLIIGGGDCGCLREVLKHQDVNHVHQVDLDEAVTRASEKYFPDLCESNNDSRAVLSFTDGVEFVENAEADSYDLIIIDSVDPVGQAARLYSEDFYRACFNALADDGIMIAQSESPLFHKSLIESMQSRMVNVGYKSVTSLFFPQCTYPSGWWSASMALKGNKATENRKVDIETKYYNNDIHQAAQAVPQFMRNFA
ncbi:MAG: polyamine aminopropyltransferase [Gammaproteobacteria bacterium]|nr:polyamine aminopropyltransferase [Gammaproteobacteria bacterium]